jgi:phytoene dehydrogenase-like protein
MNVWIYHAGHNGLVAAAYLQKSGIQTCVLEKRHVVGGAAVTEEIVPGFKFSRASYVLSLLRPHIFSDLELKVCMHHMLMSLSVTVPS